MEKICVKIWEPIVGHEHYERDSKESNAIALRRRRSQRNIPKEEDVFRKAEKALTEYFTLQKNLELEVYKFRQAKQLTGENISVYHIKLKQLAKSCDIHDEEKEK